MTSCGLLSRSAPSVAGSRNESGSSPGERARTRAPSPSDLEVAEPQPVARPRHPDVQLSPLTFHPLPVRLVRLAGLPPTRTIGEAGQECVLELQPLCTLERPDLHVIAGDAVVVTQVDV